MYRTQKKLFNLLLVCLLIVSCASLDPNPDLVSAGQKAAPFNPGLGSGNCAKDGSITTGLKGFACGRENGVRYIKHILSSWALTKEQIDQRALTPTAQ